MEHVKLFIVNHKADILAMVTSSGAYTLAEYWQAQELLAVIAKGLSVVAALFFTALQGYKLFKYIRDDRKHN